MYIRYFYDDSLLIIIDKHQMNIRKFSNGSLKHTSKKQQYIIDNKIL